MDGESIGTGSADARTTAHPALCPRCGYDQQGIILQWRDQCPLRSTCTECGLTFHWREVLGRQEPIADWCIEAQPTWLGVLRRMPSTLFMLLRPGRFWRTMKMWQPIQPRAFLWYIVAMVVISYLALSFVHASGAIHTYPNPNLTLQQGWVYPFLHALCFPFSGTSVGDFAFANAPQVIFPLPAPVRFLSSITGEKLTILGLVLGAQALMAGCFVLLPQSRRKAKVRWAHIGRIALYGLGFPFVLWWVSALQTSAFFLNDFNVFWLALDITARLLALLVIVLVVPLHIAWWWFATSRYLRMPHGLGISLVIHTIAGLVIFWILYIRHTGFLLS